MAKKTSKVEEITQEEFEKSLLDNVEEMQRMYLEVLSIKDRYEFDKASGNYNLKFLRQNGAITYERKTRPIIRGFLGYINPVSPKH